MNFHGPLNVNLFELLIMRLRPVIPNSLAVRFSGFLPWKVHQKGGANEAIDICICCGTRSSDPRSWGDIRLESVENKGTTVTVMLPAYRALPAQPQMPLSKQA